MSMRIVSFSIVMTFVSSSLAADEKVDQAQIAVAKQHVYGIMKRDFDSLAETYDLAVLLMPGHEFLKPSYGFAEDENRSKAMIVDRNKLIEKMQEIAKSLPEVPTEKLEAVMKDLKFAKEDVSEKDAAVVPSDPVATPNGKLSFPFTKGDAVIKVSPPRGDSMLLHLRLTDGKWKVVSEYLD